MEDSRVIFGETATCKVCIGEKEIDLCSSLLIENKSPAGFAWGYHGSGPGQLAIAILLELYGKDVASALYQDFKSDIIAAHDMNKDFVLPVSTVKAWVESQMKNYNRGRK